MRLYHGTKSGFLEQIRSHGLRPRGKKKSTWEQYPSRTDMVYLTTAYPLYFALNTIEEGELALIVEVESDRLDQSKLYPDEDFVAQVIAKQHNDDLESVHPVVRRRLLEWQHLWERSIQHLGNCCYRGRIPPRAITRYCLFDMKRTSITMMAMDPSISLANYAFCKEKYLGLVAWLFGDRPDIPTHDFELSIPGIPDEVRKIVEERQAHWKQESTDRTGVTVCTMNC